MNIVSLFALILLTGVNGYWNNKGFFGDFDNMIAYSKKGLRKKKRFTEIPDLKFYSFRTISN